MKYSISVVMLLVSMTLFSCEKTPQKLVIGTWVGTERPDVDTVFFMENTVQFVGLAGIDGENPYEIDEDEIFVEYGNREISIDYELINNDKIFIDGIVTGPTSLGIEYQKINN